jgi:hypothetical protein
MDTSMQFTNNATSTTAKIVHLDHSQLVRDCSTPASLVTTLKTTLFYISKYKSTNINICITHTIAHIDETVLLL